MQSLQHLSRPSAAIKTRGALPAATRPAPAKGAWATIQRAPTCACGGSCPRCQSAASGLKISEPNDPYEREADAVADRVMRMAGAERPAAPTEPVLQPKRATYQGKDDEEKLLQTKAESSSFSAQSSPGCSSAPSSVHAALSAPGQPLAAETRAFFEPRFGHDFSGVRVHTGAAAEQSAREVNAKAYTVGDDIVFGVGRLAPETHEGRRLIAHELTHVVQQTGPDVIRLIQSGENRGLSPVHLGVAKPTRSTPPGRAPLLSVALRVQRLETENATTGVTTSASAIPLFCGPYEDWIRYVLGIDPGVISDFTTCFCFGAGIADALPVIGANPGIEFADCMCNLLTNLQLAFNLASHGGCLDFSKVTELDAARVGAYLGATVVDCGSTFVMLAGALISGLTGVTSGAVSGGPPGAVGGGLGGVGAGVVAGDIFVEVITMVAQNLALQGTSLPNSQLQACQRTLGRFKEGVLTPRR